MVLENEVSHLAEDDGEQLARLLNDVAEEDPEGLLGTGYDVESLDALLAGLQAEEFGKTIGEVAEGGEDPLLMPEDLVDSLFPSDNEWGIPTLDADLQGEHVATPIIKWGTIARASRMQGTWHFYTDDYKFSALWADPTPVINSRCYGAIEPNVSTGLQSPKAYGLWATFQKRWIARYWQSYGLRIFVDLNVEPHLADLNLLGVPRGWRAYATRWPTKDPAIVEHDFAVAAQHAEGKPLFVVYGGGCEAVETCGARGWVHIPERMREIERQKRRNTVGGSATVV